MRKIYRNYRQGRAAACDRHPLARISPGYCRRPTTPYHEDPEQHQAWARCELACLFNNYLRLIKHRNAISNWEKSPKVVAYFNDTLFKEARQLTEVLKVYGYQFRPEYDLATAQPGDGAIFDELITLIS